MKLDTVRRWQPWQETAQTQERSRRQTVTERRRDSFDAGVVLTTTVMTMTMMMMMRCGHDWCCWDPPWSESAHCGHGAVGRYLLRKDLCCFFAFLLWSEKVSSLIWAFFSAHGSAQSVWPCKTKSYFGCPRLSTASSEKGGLRRHHASSSSSSSSPPSSSHAPSYCAHTYMLHVHVSLGRFAAIQ